MRERDREGKANGPEGGRHKWNLKEEPPCTRLGPGTGPGKRGVLSLAVLTLCVAAFTDDPEVQQGCALLQQRVGVFYPDPVDVFHAELQLPGQLCKQRAKAGCEPSRSSAPAPTRGPVDRDVPRGAPLDLVFLPNKKHQVKRRHLPLCSPRKWGRSRGAQ